ncbi:syntaxin-17 isoform X1 [Hyperolius riggenbachi]|uniref:syntaxin-17 isoform X1 n=1 Tax=Hyperolius riggenbachi TaxID=752182 RepID=UPI0035A32A65
MLENEQSVPYRRLEPAVIKFTKVVIPTDLERLKNHHLNIEKYQRCRSWDQLHKEHVNARCTVQQLRANIKEMETLFLKVRTKDIQTLAAVLLPVKDLALSSISSFLELHSKSVEDLMLLEKKEEQDTVISKDALYIYESDSLSDVQFLQIQEQVTSESWHTLEKDLLDLNDIVNEFSHQICAQQEKIDSIEDHVNTAAVNVEEGTTNLEKALKYKLAVLPAAGALIGGILGGPVGLLAGFKVAGIATAIGGGLLGFTGGKMLQRKKENTGKEEVCNTKDSVQVEEKSSQRTS